jgi:hypothetical protein
VQPSVVFFHVMKCAGTSVRDGLAKGVAGYRFGPEVFELDGEMAKRAAAGKDPENWRFRDALLAYLIMAEHRKVVLGHFRYRDRYESLIDDAHFVTVLRDPVERLVSLYKYRRFKDDVDVPVSMSFEEFIATPRWSKEGHQYVTTFRGNDDLDPRSDEGVEAAISNLRRFAAVGFTDRLDEFASRIGQLVERQVTIPVMNTSPAPQGSDDREFTADVLAFAKDVCAPDLAVFEQLASESARSATSDRSSEANHHIAAGDAS